MKKAEKLEDLFSNINDVAMNYDWSKEKPDSLFFIGCNAEHVIQKTIGHSDRVAVALVEAMLQDDCVKDIVAAAYEGYINVKAKKMASILEPLVKHVGKIVKSLEGDSNAPCAVALEGAKFKSRMS